VTKLILPRRKFLMGLGASIIAAPAVVRAASLMKISAVEEDAAFVWESYASEFPLSELARITRQDFIPSVYVQIHKPNLLLRQFAQGDHA
jgi:hypothetical protein